ncbi:hypothetical protein R3P38DRAFT_3535052 [Favolaschia claudopus]|uniref:Uncharacterized protein n=1 Tax=Favolaschia claudopus TaxID=2862362 RepID=A0AAW0BF34_9AGAR
MAVASMDPRRRWPQAQPYRDCARVGETRHALRKSSRQRNSKSRCISESVATYNRLPLSNPTNSLPHINFPEYFAAFTPRYFADNKSSIDTSAEVVEALVLRATLALSPHLGMATEAWQAQRTLLETLTGIKKGEVGDRAEYCVSQAENILVSPDAVGRYFVNETFSGDSREKGTKIVTDIVEAFKSSQPNITWLGEAPANVVAQKDVWRNIGDSWSIFAYRAWKAQYTDSLIAGYEYLLPGMNYTREQSFSISFGRIWGNFINTAAQIQWVRTDPHSPQIYRVDGTVSNIPAFAAAF